jgi:predicted nucleic acid-binding protein
VTDVVLGEFLHTRSRRTSRREATLLAASTIGLVSDVLPVTPAARDRALEIYRGSERLSSNDALIAAVALDTGATLVSADRDFQDVIGLDLVEPEALAAQLAA